MATPKEHGRTVLSGIIPARLDLLEEALKELTPEHFVDPIQTQMFRFLSYYFHQTNGVLTTGALTDLLGRISSDLGRNALYEENYEDYKSAHVDDADFLWAVHELKEEYANNQVKTALADTMEIIQSGKELKNGEMLKGQEAAREFLSERLLDIGSVVDSQDAPHGNIRDEGALIINEYQAIKEATKQGHQSGIQFGIPELDAKVGGLQRGDLTLSAAYTNDGKTTLCVQLAWSAAVQQGKNVLFLSTETVNTVVRRRLVSRHSRHEKFAEFGLPEGLNSKDLKHGTLTEEEEKYLEAVALDFGNRKNQYGELEIRQVPRGANMSVIEQMMYDTQKTFDIDLVVCDYLALLQPQGFRNTDRESLTGILKNSKQISTTFHKGRGVSFASPWQTSRQAWEDAHTTGRYTLKALAETAEAERTPDSIITILAPQDNTERYANLVAQVLKNRDGETADGIQVMVDYATSHFSGRSTLDSFSSASSGSAFGGLDSLI